MTAHWADVGEAGATAGIWSLYWIHRLFGRWPFRVFLTPIVLYYLAARPLARRASMEYLTQLQAATGRLGRKPSWLHVYRHLWLFADSLLDKVLAVSARYEFQNVRAEGREVMLRMLDAKRGGILITAHMGSLEVIRAASGHRPDFRLNILVHTKHAERFNKILQRLNPQTAVNLLQVSELNPATAMLLAEKVSRGEFIAIAGDRIPLSSAPRCVWVPFLGRPAPFPVGPYVLASMLGCPLVSMMCVHDRPGYLVHFEPFGDRIEIDRKDRQKRWTLLATEFAQRLERNCRKSPFDWFNFYHFWNNAPIRGDVSHESGLH